jgi:beta-galactosidase
VAFYTEGPIEIIGTKISALRGGAGGTYIRTTGEKGKAKLTVKGPAAEAAVEFEVV